MAKKHVFLSYAGPSLGMLQTNQCHHQMHNQVLQHLFGVRGPIVKTGGKSPETCFSHLCRAFPGRAREKPMVSPDAQSSSATPFRGWGPIVKTGGRYPRKTCYSHLCRAFP